MSDVASADNRPRPQFGEYASREEQLAHIKQPSPEQIDPSPPAAKQATPASSPDARMLRGAAAPVDPAVVAASRNMFNRVATIAFLAYGLVEIIVTLPNFFDFGVLINQQLETLGQGFGVTFATYLATPITVWAGRGLAALWILIWIGAALWSWSRIRRNKLAIWVPFLAGVVANLLVGVVVAVQIFSDPTLVQQLMDAVRG